MGWGWRRYGWGGYGGYGRSHQPGKKATAKSLSTATLQRIIAQQKAEEEAQARYYIQAAAARRAAEERDAEEARLEEQHGGKEALALWRIENATRLEAERKAKQEEERQAAAEKRLTNSIAELRAELAQLPRGVGAAVKASFQMNKAQVKANFHLTDREIGLVPGQAQATGRSKMLWLSTDIFSAVERKEGRKKLRAYQAAYNPSLARQSIEDELALLESQHPTLVEQGRVAAVVTLREADDAAISAAKAAEQQVEAAYRALEAARAKQHKARAALANVATRDELVAMNLAEIPNDDEDAAEAESEEEEEEPPPAPASSKAAGKQPIKRPIKSPATAGGSSCAANAKKKRPRTDESTVANKPLSTSRPSRNLKPVDYGGMDEDSAVVAGSSSAGGLLMVD